MEEGEPEASGEAPVVAAAIPQQGAEDSPNPPQQRRPPGRPEKQAQNTPSSGRKGRSIACGSQEHRISAKCGQIICRSTQSIRGNVRYVLSRDTLPTYAS